MFRFPTPTETLDVWERIEQAIADEKPVTLTFFKEKEISYTRRRHGKTETVTYTGYVRARRTVEPWLLGFHQSDGHAYARVISRSPTDEKGPMFRTIRLDRVAVSRTTGKPLLTVHVKGKRYCQGLIDVGLERERLRAERNA